MLLSSSPRKVVPLATGDDDWESGPSSKPTMVTKRVFFCGVVVENEDGLELSEDVRELVASFGDPVHIDNTNDTVDLNSSNGMPSDTDNRTRRRAMTNTSAIQDIINELVNTERTYVKKLRVLKHDYADPLRSYARSKETAIIPAYEANTLFGNIDALLPVNEAFLEDLERMVAVDGPQTVGYIGDIALRHFKELRGFDLYKHFYVKREEAQSIFEREMSKKSRFYTFVDRIKYSSADMKNRVGLRELMMEPVQRIPRYTLMFRTMLQRMAPGDAQYAKLMEADEIASKIALAEADDATKRAAVMHCLAQTIEGFPPALVSHSRRLVDCIDVDDGSDSQGPGPAGVLEPLRCTLFLFDDKLVIVKRPTEKSGRVLSGLEKLEKMGKVGGLPSGLKKGALACRGVVDLSELVATDVGGSDLHLFLESPPLDQPDRWTSRPFRSLSCVHPPSPANFNPQQAAHSKKRFLEHLWQAQVDLRTRSGHSITLEAEEREVEAKAGKVTVARAYFHVYQRTSFLREAKKTKVVVQIDPFGNADPLPLGSQGPPYIVIRVQPIEGDLSRYRVISSDPHDDHNEEDIVQTGRVPDRVIQTIQQYGLFKFRTGKNSAPSTPTASSRSRAAMFGLDVISRNLFGALPGTSAKHDAFGNSLNGSRRSKSTTRSSVYTQSSDSSLMRFTHRSNSSSMTSVEDDSFSSNKSSSRSRKLLRTRSKSPTASGSESESLSRRKRAHSRTNSQAQSREASPALTDEGEGEGTLQQHGAVADGSEWDLTQRLELARRNSQNQHGGYTKQPSWNEPVSETIYEETPPPPIRSNSRASTAQQSHRSTTPQPRPVTPSYDRGASLDRVPSQHSDRPRGPRSPSPAPPLRHLTPSPGPVSVEGSPMDMESAIEATLLNIQRPTTPVRPVSPVGRPLPSRPASSVFRTPSRASSTHIEPLSIKKRDSVNDGPMRTPKTFSKTSPLTKGRIVSPRRVSPLIRHSKTKLAATDFDEELVTRLHESVRDGIESSSRAVKRIKTNAEQLRVSLGRATDGDESPPFPLPNTPRGVPRTPQRTQASPMNKAALDRMEEMRQLIGKRATADFSTPRSRPLSYAAPQTPLSTGTSVVTTGLSLSEEIVHPIEEAASEADKALLRAATSHDALASDIGDIVANLKEKTAQLAKARAELQNQKRQCELVKSLLNNAVAENALVYDTVNEELDELFKGAQLPETEAWAAMTADVRRTKAARNELAVENSQLKRQLAESESEKEEWGTLLRQHGLIS